MKNKVVLLFLFCWILVACVSGKTSTPKGEYNLTMGKFSTDFNTFAAAIGSKGWTLIQTDDTGGSAYATGADAQSIRTYCVNAVNFTDVGLAEHSYENLLNYICQGVGLPPSLKLHMSDKKTSVPIVGIFANGQATLVFYINKN
jgi:hypothetical protein